MDDPRTKAWAPMLACILFAAGAARADDVTVKDKDTLIAAIKDAKPGTRVLIAPGEYVGGMYFRGIKGTKEQPIVVASADPKNLAVIKAGYCAFQFSGAEHLELRDLVCTGATHDGLNFDGGGKFFKLSNLKVTNVRIDGNFDGIKLSGVTDFRVENCTVENFGGEGIDMVACARATIEGCTFRNQDSRTEAAAVQAKGGSFEIAVRRNRFEQGKSRRGVNIGGSTGHQFFFLVGRPEKDAWEAKDIVVEGNIFVGCGGPICFVTTAGGVARFNTIYHPDRWAIRILQEQPTDKFVRSRNGVFEDNVVVYRSDKWSEGGINVSGGTAPETFRFARNLWYCEDKPESSRRDLPKGAEETDGAIGKDPMFVDPAKGDFALKKGSPAKGKGHTALAGGAEPGKRE